MLLTRRNEGLESILRDFVEQLKQQNEDGTGKGKKKDGAKAKRKGKAKEANEFE